MILNERENRRERMQDAVRQIMAAGRTAPKGKGVDNIEIITLMDEHIGQLSQAMREASEENGMKFFLRDADNIMQAEAVILVGAKTLPMGLNCGYCGHPTCADRNAHPEVPCALNMVDLGIALGSMTAMAADLRIDNRVMFSAGIAALRMGLLKECHAVFAVPLSISSKNPFFDRQSTR